MNEVASEITRRLLQVSYLPGIGTVALRKVVMLAAEMGLESISDDNEILRKFNKSNAKKGKQCGDRSPKVLDSCEQHNIRILSPLDEEYPSALMHIEDYPPLLYIKGNVDTLSKLGCAVVGTRNASHLGKSWAKQIAEIFASRDYCVVSGLALGIDTAAHEGALKGGGTTVAVLAHGLDIVTPAKNKTLANSILENRGALIAEHPPGVPPQPPEYARRNRIQSGMSVCSVMVESKESGGTIHHANFAKNQGRQLYCVTPDETVSGYSKFEMGGAGKLISEGYAHQIHNREELLKIIDQGKFENDFVKWKKKPFIQKEKTIVQEEFFTDN